MVHPQSPLIPFLPREVGAKAKGSYDENEASEEDDSEADDGADAAAVKFCNNTLSVLCSCVVACFLVELVKVKKMTAPGVCHCMSDVAYLRNVLNALGMRSSALILTHVLMMLEVGEGELSRIVEEGRGAQHPLQCFVAGLNRVCAAIRGVAVGAAGINK